MRLAGDALPSGGVEFEAQGRLPHHAAIGHAGAQGARTETGRLADWPPEAERLLLAEGHGRVRPSLSSSQFGDPVKTLHGRSGRSMSCSMSLPQSDDGHLRPSHVGWGDQMAVGQDQWYHFGVGAPPILVHFSGDWDVYWGYRLLTHGQMEQPAAPRADSSDTRASGEKWPHPFGSRLAQTALHKPLFALQGGADGARLALD